MKEVKVGAAAGLADTQPLQTLSNSQAHTSKHWCDPAPLSERRCSSGGGACEITKNILILHGGGDGDDAEERRAEWLKDNKIGGEDGGDCSVDCVK